MNEGQILLDTAQVISIMSGFVIPLLVGVLAKLSAPSWLKSALNMGFAALASVLSQVVPAEFAWHPFLVTFAMTWVTSVATYYGMWKPAGTAEVVQLRTRNVGVGSSSRRAA